MLLQKVKADNSEIAEVERRLTEAQDAIRKGRSQLTELASQMTEANDPKTQKYQELFARDKEMTELIDSFDEKKAVEVNRQETLEEKVVALLQGISRKVAQTENAGSMNEEKFNEMRSDLDFKQHQMDNSVSTSSRLQDELARRKLELEKIETLDEKISTELKQLNEKMATMATELDTYKDLGALKAQSEQKEKDLKKNKAAAIKRGDSKKGEHAELKTKHEELKRQLATDELATSLHELEEKMRHHEQTVFMLTEYIDTKGAETMFQPIAEECHHSTSAINAETIRVLADQPVFQPY
jgi:intraflagellar transport protein 74